VNEGLEIGKLIENVVSVVLVHFLFGLVKDLHSQYAENKEDEGKKMEVFDNDMHNLHKSHKYSLDVVENGLPQNFGVLGLEKHSETAKKSEKSEHFGKVECFSGRIDKDADCTHDVHDCVNNIPPVRK